MAENAGKRIDRSLLDPALVAELNAFQRKVDTVDWSMIANKPVIGLKSVANYAALPATGVVDGDVYRTVDTNEIYGWTATGWKLVQANDPSVPWTDVTGKPTTFTPTAHTHTLDDVTETVAKKIMSDAERTKLSGVAESANNYVHPASHPATMITEDATHRFATDTEKSTWNGKADVPANKAILDKVTYSGTNPSIDLKQIETNTTAIGGKVDSSTFSGHTGNTTAHVTQADKDTWNGKGDMLKSTYDADGDGIVDNAAKVGGRKFTVSATAPATPATNDIWIDLN